MESAGSEVQSGILGLNMMKYFSIQHSLQNPVLGLNAMLKTVFALRMLHVMLKGIMLAASWPHCLLSLDPDLWLSAYISYKYIFEF